MEIYWNEKRKRGNKFSSADLIEKISNDAVTIMKIIDDTYEKKSKLRLTDEN